MSVGVPLVYVDPAYTSQERSGCQHIEKANRVDQARFICRECGVVAHADRKRFPRAAHRGQTVWNVGRESRAPATP
ncbi:zinc ribbon domain-containing protein [Streptomyces oceani]|uniref:Cas12f1-like TNB domain-containing protein n=1 Tax=Streptomyces oceani TaxID=1075402 RepID=A0A1E7KIG3_9ACTN|nr:zinc ribbon domain-containing protein [Streptomyces oceani]OEV03693.1 hypothetical protein AN216_10615 [Streptomyces oceani]